NVLIMKNNPYIVLNYKEKFEEFLLTEDVVDSKKLLKNRLLSIYGFNGLSIALCIVILVLGLVRGA
ncbi:MAG: hypothetical protein K2L47_02920, partial [Clostridia bacterium]|nr:hypothetical protein [Clostridia bacterium]